jgi:hypothetical protein
VSGPELQSEVLGVAAISRAVRDRLLALHSQSYDGVDPERFLSDLSEKQWVILLRARGEIVGFSTQKALDVTVLDRPVRALFSGDTIVHPDYWGEQALVRAWCRLAGRLKAATQGRPLYWFLISKGHRTYLYLPTFFREFWPRRGCPTPGFEAELIRVLGRTKYPREFDPMSGRVEPRGQCDRLRAELDVAQKRQRNAHVAFFCEANPRYREGHELVCVTEIAPDNMRRIARAELVSAMSAEAAELVDAS